jgi:hypothetical protein
MYESSHWELPGPISPTGGGGVDRQLTADSSRSILSVLLSLSVRTSLSTVLWIPIWIYMDPHSFGCPGSVSILGMRIRIQEHQKVIVTLLAEVLVHLQKFKSTIGGKNDRIKAFKPLVDCVCYCHKHSVC